jgi:hypothetical protein
MSMTASISQWVVRITGVLLLILGLLIWTGDVPPSVIPVHILLGVLMVLALWLLAATASQQGVPMGLVTGVALLGLITLIVGFTQRILMPGSFHWVIQVLHLVLGMAAVAGGEMIGGTLRRLRTAPA